MRLAHAAWLAVPCLFAACSSENPQYAETPNQAPTVWLQAETPEGTGESYSVHFEWGGSDPDGNISHYEFLIADHEDGGVDPADLTGEWNAVSGNDTTIVFSTDPSQRDANSGDRSQTLFVRAVDNEMLPSSEPDYISYTSRSLLPRVRITVPPATLGITPADVAPVSTFEWVEDTGSVDPDSVQWALVNIALFNDSYTATVDYLRSFASASFWYPWVLFDDPKGGGRSWTTPELDFGGYVFAIRAKIVAGGMNPILQEPVNVRRIRVALRTTGPTLVVQHPHLGYVIGNSCDYPLTIADMAAHRPISFTFSACADHYGGTVAGYRYGWDILDLDDPEQWEVDYTPFPGPRVSTPGREFGFGVHVFTVEVKDNAGYCSRIQVKVNIVRFTGERNVLVVDDYRPDEIAGQSGWVTTNGALPNDAEHDAFWLDMMSNVDQFDPALDMIATSTNNVIPIATLAQYKSIVWSSYSDVASLNVFNLPYLYTYIQYRANLVPPSVTGPCSPTGGVLGQVVTNAIAWAIESGVHVLITGNHPVQTVVSRTVSPTGLRWPLIPVYELEPGASQIGAEPRYLVERPGRFGFAYRHLCLDAIDFAYLTTQRARFTTAGSGQRYCGITGLRTPNTTSRRDDTMRSGIPLDPNFPAISLRPEAAGAGRFYQPSQQGIDVEVYNPAYFAAACAFVPAPRSCFEPIYGVVGLDTAELTHHQPVAFWTSAFADVIAADIPGAIAARSAVFGFPPVYFDPAEIKPGIEYILFDEWQLPRVPVSTSSQ